MNKKLLVKTAAGMMVVSFALAAALPVKAFYVEVPKGFVKNWQAIIASKVKGIEESAPTAPAPAGDSGSAMQSPTFQPMTEPFQSPQPSGEGQVQPQPYQPNYQPNYQQPPSDQNFGTSGQYPAPDQNQGSQPQSGPMMGPREGDANLTPEQTKWFGTGPGDQGQNNQGQDSQGQYDDQRRQEDDQRRQEMDKKNQERQAADVKRGMRQMESELKRLESLFKRAENKGTVIPQEVKDNLAKAKSMIDSIKSASSAEDMQSIDMGALSELIQALNEARENVVEAGQRLNDIKRQMKMPEQGLKMFEKMIAKLPKQNIVVPDQIKDNLNRVKAMMAAVKQAKTWEEIEAAGIEDMQEAMMELDQSRGQIEMLLRWPQTLKDMNRELNRLVSELKKAKKIVDKLKGKGIDLSDKYAEFEAAVNKLKEVKNQAVEQIKSSDSAEAFETLQDDFFGQLEDVWQHSQIIMTISNLGRFNADFKRGINQAQAQIKKLKRQKIDTAELEELLNEAKAKGAEMLNLLKVKEIDEDAIAAALEELETLKQQFDDLAAELSGVDTDIMPWEQGQEQLKGANMNMNWNNFMPKKSASKEQPAAEKNNKEQPVALPQE